MIRMMCLLTIAAAGITAFQAVNYFGLAVEWATPNPEFWGPDAVDAVAQAIPLLWGMTAFFAALSVAFVWLTIVGFRESRRYA